MGEAKPRKQRNQGAKYATVGANKMDLECLKGLSKANDGRVADELLR